LALLLASPAIAGAERPPDSPDLVARLESVSGRERVDLLNEISKSRWGVSAEETIAWATQALELAREIGYEAGEACALRYQGIGHWYRDDYQNALDRTLAALEIFERIGDKAGIAACRSTIGTVHLNLERYDLALESYTAALAIAEETGDENRLGIVLSNLGTTMLGLERPADALGYFERALALLEREGSELDVLTALGNIGGALRRLDRLDEALAVNARILEIAERVDSRVRLADALTDTGEILTLQGKSAEALPYVERAIEVATAADLKRNLHEAELVLVRIHEARGDWRRALEHQKRNAEIRNAILTEESTRAIAELQVRYDTEKKELEIQKQKLELERQRNARNVLIGVSALVLVLLAASIGRYRAKQRENRLLDRLSRTDPLTGLANRRALLESIDREAKRSARGAAPPALVLLDVDHFKRFNDEHGHDAGDEVLVEVAGALRRSVREVDEVARWGGEEFLVLLPGCELAEATEVAGRAAAEIRRISLERAGKTLRVTATLGVTTLGPDEPVDSALRRADEALYAGKQSGRDRVEPRASGAVDSAPEAR
jgi:diguanylate cyclase (GGDEF)-like protein